MQLFKLKTRLSEFDSFVDFAKEFNLTKEDLIITNEFLYNPYMRGLNLPCRFIMQEQYGMGEPSDEMINHILADIQLENYTRVIAVGEEPSLTSLNYLLCVASLMQRMLSNAKYPLKKPVNW